MITISHFSSLQLNILGVILTYIYRDICDHPRANRAKCAGTASATLKPRISRTLGARKLILGTAIGVVYLQTGNGSRAVSRRSVTCDRTRSGKIGLIFGAVAAER